MSAGGTRVSTYEHAESAHVATGRHIHCEPFSFGKWSCGDPDRHGYLLRWCAVALDSAPLTNGQAVFRNSTLRGGSQSITAAYSGDGQFNPHNAAPVTETVLTPVVNLNPAALNFGNQKVGTTSAGQAVRLTNRGPGALTIAGSTTTGSYSQTNNCGASLASSKSCTITVKFTPSALGTQSGTLSI